MPKRSAAVVPEGRREVRRAHRLAGLARKLGPSIILFLSGAGALFLADLVIARTGRAEDIALWATLKSFMMIGSTFALFGINQLIVREPLAWRMLLRVGVANILAVSLVLGVLGDAFDVVANGFVGAIAIAGFSLFNIAFQWLRSNLRVTEAYVVNSSWRVLFLFGVVIFGILSDLAGIDTILISSFAIGAVVVVGILSRKVPQPELVALHDDVRSVKDAYLLGASFFVSALSLAIASYGENLVVQQLGTTADVAQYFRAAVMFLFPGMMLNQYLTAVLGTVLRQQEQRVLGILRRHYWRGVLGFALLWPLLVLGGYVLEVLVYGAAETPAVLAALLALTSCVRLLYVLPGAFVGVIADRNALSRASAVYLAGALSLPVFSVVFHAVGLAIVTSVALASLINWVLRSLVGVRLVAKRIAMDRQRGV